MTTTPSVGVPGSPLPRSSAWMSSAACRDHWTDLDWIEPSPEQEQRCRALCARCPVRQTCLNRALTAAEPWGIWGGLDPDQRAVLARLIGFPIPAALPLHGFRARYARHGCRCAACRYAHTTYERQRRRHKASAA
jgi:WhiB family redox-sensing transcriptional regulator